MGGVILKQIDYSHFSCLKNFFGGNHLPFYNSVFTTGRPSISTFKHPAIFYLTKTLFCWEIFLHPWRMDPGIFS